VSHFQEQRRDKLVLGFEMSVERAGAQPSAVKDGGDAEPLNAMFANRFRRGSQDGAAHTGVGGEFVALSYAWSGHAVAS
jgi:hypothetical protein